MRRARCRTGKYRSSRMDHYGCVHRPIRTGNLCKPCERLVEAARDMAAPQPGSLYFGPKSVLLFRLVTTVPPWGGGWTLSIWSARERPRLASSLLGSRPSISTGAGTPGFPPPSIGPRRAKVVRASGTGQTCGAGPGRRAFQSSPTLVPCVVRTLHRVPPVALTSTTSLAVRRSLSVWASASFSASTSCARRTRPFRLRCSPAPAGVGESTCGRGATCGAGRNGRDGGSRWTWADRLSHSLAATGPRVLARQLLRAASGGKRTARRCSTVRPPAAWGPPLQAGWGGALQLPVPPPVQSPCDQPRSAQCCPWLGP